MSDEIFTIDSDEMMAATQALTAIRKFAKGKKGSLNDFVAYLRQQEIIEEYFDNTTGFNKPNLKVMKQTEDKFRKRLKHHKVKFDG